MMWRSMKKLTSGLITTVLSMLLIVTVFTVILQQATDGTPNVFGYQLKTVLSGSMEPEFQTGSIISIHPQEDTTQFQKGDIITFQNSDGMVITHRVEEVKNNGEQYVTKGDNNNRADSELVVADSILGQYTGFTIPYVGYATQFANSEEGALFLLIIPGVMLVGYSIINIGRALRQVETSSKEKTEVSNHQ
ncbi:signal peptidase [Oceanobacillus iheyensis HTE831]|uniref:Signal peptidase I n=1 Tax=Oceanobacillus iheyensis (strain DSM 14371 / CIP 107618 / JCM 11309 / KCTC 3954 / HTE831) TaxID=221109 RepID=Q8ES43_OCEIH|nr:signal peptidase I [Oceanobacillus iheyensis]BAC12756.1 signal peptidase [Oceanobacillus iheyensis HTE831]